MYRLFHISSDQLLGLKEAEPFQEDMGQKILPFENTTKDIGSRNQTPLESSTEEKSLPDTKDKPSPSGMPEKRRYGSRQAAVRKRHLADLQSDLAHLQFETNQACRPELIAQNREEISDWDPEENTILISFLMTLQHLTKDTAVHFIAEVDGTSYYTAATDSRQQCAARSAI